MSEIDDGPPELGAWAKRLREQREETLKRKDVLFREMWILQAYAGHLQIAARALLSDTRTRYGLEDGEEFDDKYLRQLDLIAQRDLRYPEVDPSGE